MEWVSKPLEKITQGSIVDGIKWGGEELLSIILSNACDLEHGKSGFIIVASLIPARETISSSREFMDKVKSADGNKTLSNKQWKSLCDLLSGYIHNKNICRYYFIDLNPIINTPPFFVDFQLIQSVPFEDVANFDNIAQLKSPFVEQMMMRFVSYTARIPSDRVEQEKENEYIEMLANGYHKT